MSIIYILIPIAILLTSLGIYLFFWAVKTEQFDDLEKQGMSILFDDEHQTTHSDKELGDNLANSTNKDTKNNKEENIENSKNSSTHV